MLCYGFVNSALVLVDPNCISKNIIWRDGFPCLAVGSTTLPCQHGTDFNLTQKQKYDAKISVSCVLIPLSIADGKLAGCYL